MLMISLGILTLAVVASSTVTHERSWSPLLFAKTLPVSTFEWFGELGLFCVGLGRAVVAPPCYFAQLIRQCDEIGSKSLPRMALAGAATRWFGSLRRSRPCRRSSSSFRN